MILASLRPAKVSDIPAMHALRMSVRENRLSDPLLVTEASYLPFVRQGACWVICRASTVIGFSALDTRAKEVWALFVEPQAEGRGCGRLLLSAVVDAARDLRLDRLSLRTEAGTRAGAFYERLGWRKAEGHTETGEQSFTLTL